MPTFLHRKYSLFNDKTNNRQPVLPRICGKMKSMLSCIDLRAWNLNDQLRREFLNDLLSADEATKGIKLGFLIPIEIILDNLFFNVLSNCEFLRRKKENVIKSIETCVCKICPSLKFGFDCPCEKNKFLTSNPQQARRVSFSKPNQDCTLCLNCRNVMCKCPQTKCSSCPETGRCGSKCPSYSRQSKPTTNQDTTNQRYVPVSYVQIKNKFQWNTLRPHPATSTFSRGYLSSFAIRPSSRLFQKSTTPNQVSPGMPPPKLLNTEVVFSNNNSQIYRANYGNQDFKRIANKSFSIRTTSSKSTSGFTFDIPTSDKSSNGKCCCNPCPLVRPKSEPSEIFKNKTSTCSNHPKNINFSFEPKKINKAYTQSLKTQKYDFDIANNYKNNMTKNQNFEISSKYSTQNRSFCFNKKPDFEHQCNKPAIEKNSHKFREHIKELYQSTDRNSKLFLTIPKTTINMSKIERIKSSVMSIKENVSKNSKNNQIDRMSNTLKNKGICKDLHEKNLKNFDSVYLHPTKIPTKSVRIKLEEKFLESPNNTFTSLKKPLESKENAKHILYSWKSSQKKNDEVKEPAKNSPNESSLNNPFNAHKTDFQIMQYLQNIISKPLEENNFKSTEKTCNDTSWRNQEKNIKKTFENLLDKEDENLQARLSKKLSEIKSRTDEMKNEKGDFKSLKNNFSKYNMEINKIQKYVLKKASENNIDSVLVPENDPNTYSNEDSVNTKKPLVTFNERIDSLIQSINSIKSPTFKSSHTNTKNSKVHMDISKRSSNRNIKSHSDFNCDSNENRTSTKPSNITVKLCQSSSKKLPVSSKSKSGEIIPIKVKFLSKPSRFAKKMCTENTNKPWSSGGSSEESYKISSTEGTIVGDRDFNPTFRINEES